MSSSEQIFTLVYSTKYEITLVVHDIDLVRKRLVVPIIIVTLYEEQVDCFSHFGTLQSRIHKATDLFVTIVPQQLA